MQNEKIYLSIPEAARHAKVEPQSIWVAIRKNKIKATKCGIITSTGKFTLGWVILVNDLDDYRKNRFNRDRRIVDGKKLFDIGAGRFSVFHVSKILSSRLNRKITIDRIYYLIYRGHLRAAKNSGAWVISNEELEKVHQLEKQIFPLQQDLI